MSTFTQDPPDAQAPAAKQRRLRVNVEVLENAKGVARTTIELLRVAADMTQNVPYLGAISTALTEFMRMQDEVGVCKDECRATMNDARQLNSLILKFRDKCVESGRSESPLTDILQESFTDLERIVLESVRALHECKVDSARWKDRIRIYWKRNELTQSVRGCAAQMDKALQRFSTILQVDQVFLLEDIRVVVGEIRENVRSPAVQQESILITSKRAARLRAAPSIFYGREEEVQHAVELIMHQAPARVAILGPGGIGKTSISLTVLHHPAVVEMYDGMRFFVSCENATTAENVVYELAKALGVTIHDNESARSFLLSGLESATAMICLDNLETPWDADTAAVEELLIELAALPSIALMITSRVLDTPLIDWASPPLAPIAPYTFEAALQTWDAICHDHDEHVDELIEAVDRIPLAVTLLARLARAQSSQDILSRWNSERTELIRANGIEHRLNSLRVSIELSLQSLHDQAAIDLLSFLCLLPYGLMEICVPDLEMALKDYVPLKRCLTLLKQFSLAYSQETTYGYGSPTSATRVLSPIVHHMLQHRPVPERLLICLADVYCRDPLECGYPQDPENVLMFLELGLKYECIRERCLKTIGRALGSRKYPNWWVHWVKASVDFCMRAKEVASKYQSPSESAICLQLSLKMFYEVLGYRYSNAVKKEKLTRAENMTRRAVEVAERAGDIRAQMESWDAFVEAHINLVGETVEPGNLDELSNMDEARAAVAKAWTLYRQLDLQDDRDKLEIESRLSYLSYNISFTLDHLHSLRVHGEGPSSIGDPRLLRSTVRPK